MAFDRTIYSSENRFRLILDDVSYTIREPVNWNSAKITITRAIEEYGASFSFPEKTIKLGFTYVPHPDTATRSKELIDNAYNQNSVDADAILVFEATINNVLTEITRVKADFNTIDQRQNITEVQFKEIKFEELVRNRFSTNIALNNSVSIDGNRMSSISFRDFELHSKLVRREFFSRNQVQTFSKNLFTGELGLNSDVALSYIKIGGINPETDDIPGVFENHAISQLVPENNKLYLHQVEESGTYTYKGIISFSLNINIKGYSFQNWISTIKMTIPSQGIDITFYDDDRTFRFVDTFGSRLFIREYSLTFEETFELIPGDEVYFYATSYMDISRDSGDPPVVFKHQVTFRDNHRLEIEADTSFVETETKGYRLFDAVKRNVESISNENDSLTSDFLDGGAANNYGYTSGNRIRLIEKPILINLKDALEALHGIFNCGFEFKNNKLRIEPIDYFFQDNLLLTLTSISNLSITTNTEITFNEAKFTFPDTVDEEANTLDAIHTERNYLLTITNASSTYTANVPWRADAYDIEFTRRKSVDSESFKTDDDGFIIALNSTLDAAEKNEPFDLVDNVVGPESIYNGRISTARNYLNHATLLNSCQSKKNSSETVKNTFTENNGEAITRFKTTETNRLGDPNRLTIQEDMNFTLQQSNDFKHVFGTRKFKFSCEIEYMDVLALVNNPNGYIEIPDHAGNTLRGFIFNFEYDPATNQADIELWEKGNM